MKENEMTEEHIKNILQTMANIVGEQKGIEITVEIKRKELKVNQ